MEQVQPQREQRRLRRSHTFAATIAIQHSKLDTTGDFPHHTVPGAEWAELLAAAKSHALDR